MIPTDMHWYKSKVKVEIGTAKGKKAHAKQLDQKNRDGERQKRG